MKPTLHFMLCGKAIQHFKFCGKQNISFKKTVHTNRLFDFYEMRFAHEMSHCVAGDLK